MARNYGAVSDGDHAASNGLLNHADMERAALLTKDHNQRPIVARLREHFSRDIRKDWGDLVLLFCYVITGLLDSSSVQVWGSFVSMQTGNTVYLGLGLAAPHDSTRWIRSGISIAFFCLGSMFFSSYHRGLGSRKRWVMVSSYFLQTVCMLGAALMVTFGPDPGKGAGSEVTVWIAVPLALIAFQAGGQAYTSRVLQYSGLTSVVLTSIYCDLFSDQRLFTSGLSDNPERNRRAAAPVLVLIGAVVGGIWAHSEIGLAGALWTALVLKVGVTVTWAIWKAEKET